MRIGALEASELFVRAHFPDCLLAVLGGSVSRDGHNSHSDLDIVVLDGGESGPYRKVVKAYEWIIECFVLTPPTYRDIFDAGIEAANPSLQHMLAKGIVIRSRPEGSVLIDEAREDLANGPMPWSSYELDFARYTITDVLEDLRGADNRPEMLFAANKLVLLLCEFLLRTNNQWVGEGKHLYRFLVSHSPQRAKQLTEAMDALYRSEDRKPLETLCVETLSPYGGLLLEGYEG